MPQSSSSPFEFSRRGFVVGATAGLASQAQAGKLGKILKQLGDTPQPAQQPAAQPTSEAAAQAVAGTPSGRQSLVPLGYSARFNAVRDLIARANYADALKNYDLTPPAKGQQSHSIVRDRYLAHAELGLINFEFGRMDEAATHLRAAEDTLANSQQTSTAGTGRKIGNFFKTVAGKVSGQEELSDYTPLDHEAILELNYLTLSHLLKGERQCYNVTRRCIDQQGLLKIKFEKQIEEYKQKLAKQTADPNTVSADDRAALNGLANEFGAYGSYAGRVANAYVNPLGDYLAGLIQEIASQEQPALRDNSRIAYLNASKLAGRSPQLVSAATAMARPRVPAKERVVHVIVGEGFAPAREVMLFGLKLGNQVLPIRVPIFTPVPSGVQRVDILSVGGPRLATMDPIGDFEAIRMRDQQDRTPMIMFGVTESVLADYFESKTAAKAGALGQLAMTIKQSQASPDTRSWLSLPRRFHVARITPAPGVSAIQIAAFSATGQRMVSMPIPLLPGEPQSVVYVRVTDIGIQIQGTRKLWIDGRLDGIA